MLQYTVDTKGDVILFSRIFLRFFEYEYEIAPYFIQLKKPKLDIGLFLDFCVFTCFNQFLHHVIIKLFGRSGMMYDTKNDIF